MNAFKNIEVQCRCGLKLLKYKKRGKGRLQKIHRDRIAQDYFGLFSGFDAEGVEILCPVCGARFATIRSLQGKYVAKVNQGQLGIIRGGRG
jgi:hypothetical protein